MPVVQSVGDQDRSVGPVRKPDQNQRLVGMISQRVGEIAPLFFAIGFGVERTKGDVALED